MDLSVGCAKHRSVLSWTWTPLQSVTHGVPSVRAVARNGPALTDRPLLRFVGPTTLEATGSDLHQACLARLCSAFRFSQPPGALLLPKPFRLCFTPVTSLGFSLQRFDPPT